MINFLVQQIPIIDDGEWSDRDEAEGEEDELEEEEEEEDVPATKKNKLEAGKAEEAQGPKEAATPPPAIKQWVLSFELVEGEKGQTLCKRDNCLEEGNLLV